MINRRRSLAIAAALVLLLCPGSLSAQALRLVFFTDVHTRTEWQTPQALAQAAQAINAQKPDLVLGGGDLITDGFQATNAAEVEPRWQAYFENFHRAIRAPVYSAIGNHDLVAARPADGSAPSADPKAIFCSKLGVKKPYQSFNTHDYHIILLDSVRLTPDKQQYEGGLDAGQMDWLKSDLAGVDPATPIVVALHLPLVTAYYQITEGATNAAPPNRVVANSREVLAAFKGHKLALVLQGHLHVNEMIRWRATTFITGGAICGQWWRGPWQGTPAGFVVVELKDGQAADWKYVDYAWTARRPPRE